VDAASFAGTTAVRADVAGGFGTVGGVAFASRPVLDSFGVVRIAGVPGIDVYQNGNLAGRTDAEGVVVMTQLFPYLRNRITIDEKAVPIHVALATRDQFVSPYFRSGVIVDFGAHRLVNATVLVRLPDGRPLPSGAEVRLPGSRVTYPVGNDGEVFIQDLAYGTRYEVEFAGVSCTFEVAAATSATEDLPRLGPFTCVAAKE
jgi:outer membrane usher protein